jgi:hypothetical protein
LLLDFNGGFRVVFAQRHDDNALAKLEFDPPGARLPRTVDQLRDLALQ